MDFMDFVDFKRIVYGLAQATGRTVGPLHQAGVTPTFHAAALTQYGNTVFILCSVHGDWACSSFFDPAECRLEFREDRELSAWLLQYHGVQLLGPSQLNGPFSDRHYLSAADVKYWCPATLGEALFNWWD